MVKTSTTDISSTICVARITMPDDTVQTVPLGFKGTWTPAKVEKNGFHGQIPNFVYNGEIFKGVIMFYALNAKKN
jgi:hypothetical protein